MRFPLSCARKPQTFAPILRTSQQGVGMLEVLIALLVLAIGILGLASLQTLGLKFNHESYHRTQAVFHIYDIADRVRSNPAGRVVGGYNFARSGTAPAYNDCTTITCTPTERAAFDIGRWIQSMKDELGTQTEGAIQPVPGTTLLRIEVSWFENDVRKNFVQEMQL